MNRNYIPIIVARVVLVGLVIATIGPVEIRPSLGLPLKVERFLGFAIVGALFASAYPSRWIAILALATALAIGLEALQLIVPTRDASPIDAIVKIAGAATGVIAIRLLYRRLQSGKGRWPSAPPSREDRTVKSLGSGGSGDNDLKDQG